MTALPAIRPPEMAVVPVSPHEQMKQAADMAKLLKDVVAQAGLAKKLGGRKEHLEFEAWQTIARWHQCTPSTEWTRPIKDGEKIVGWEARVNVLDATGRVIGSAEGMCMGDEQNWRGKPSYALRSMAQTRTAGKALRSLFAHIAVLAGYSATPADEMDGIHVTTHEDRTSPEPSKPAPERKPAAPKSGNGDSIEKADIFPAEVKTAQGNGKKGPWVRYDIFDQDGVKFSTFDKKFGEMAVKAADAGTAISVTYTSGQWGNDIKHVASAEAVADIPV